MNTTLYQCTADIQAVLDAHFDSETEAADTLEAVVGQFEAKAQNVIAYHLNQLAQLEMLDKHIQAVQARKKALQAQADRLKDYLHRNMLAAGIQKIQADNGTFTASIAKSPPSVEVYDESLLPEHCFRIKREPDKTAIKAALQSGENIQGARMITNKTGLRIK